MAKTIDINIPLPPDTSNRWLTAKEVTVTLIPIDDGSSARQPRTTTVFCDYGDVRVRICQAIMDMLGGSIAYIDILRPCSPGNSDSHAYVSQLVLPILGGREGDAEAIYTTMAETLRNANHCGRPVICYNSDRRPWLLGVAPVANSASSAVDLLDTASDCMAAGPSLEEQSPSAAATVEPNGIRKKF